MDPIATDRLWLTQPRRATAIATVVAVRGQLFALDRSLFAPTSHAHRHPQPHDAGTVWIEGGEKRHLERSFVDGGVLWHRLRGTVPAVGANLNCQLDQERRALASRAHTAMHLVICALQRLSAPPMTADPCVKGGGTFRLDLDGYTAPKTLAAALAQANTWATEDHSIVVEHVPRELETRVLDAQHFAQPDPYPGPPGAVSVARVEGVCAYPCDGTHVARTPKVGSIVFAQANPSSGRTVLIGKVR